VNTGLIVGGVATFGAMYALSLGYAASNNFESGLGALAVPVLGPWIALGSRDFACDPGVTEAAALACQQKTVDEAATVAVLSGLGVAQMVGATLTMIGIFDRDELWVRSDLVEARVDVQTTPGGGTLQVHGIF
jgi:hypothetical protein